jgi:hypothetical protein
MIIVKLQGGLGNQLFQYALGRRISLLNKQYLYLDISSYESYPLRKYELSTLKLDVSLLGNSQMEKYLNPKGFKKMLSFWGYSSIGHITEKESDFFQYNSNVFNFKNSSLLLEGYWQNPAYFDCIKSVLVNDIIQLNLINRVELLKDIQQHNSVALHIRRGDYVKINPDEQIHLVLSMNYYHKAIDFLNSLYPDLKYFVFTDDPDWCKSVFDYDNFIIIEPSCDTLSDFLLMNQCKHFIIANSTYSWWAAWLNNGIDKKVIAPQKWFANDLWDASNIIPKEWLSF